MIAEKVPEEVMRKAFRGMVSWRKVGKRLWDAKTTPAPWEVVRLCH